MRKYREDDDELKPTKRVEKDRLDKHKKSIYDLWDEEVDDEEYYSEHYSDYDNDDDETY